MMPCVIGEPMFRPAARKGSASASAGRDRVHPQLVGRDHAEVRAGSAQAPQQVGVLDLAGVDQSTVGGDDVGADQVVAGQAVDGGEPAVAAAEAEAADTGGGDAPAGG